MNSDPFPALSLSWENHSDFQTQFPWLLGTPGTKSAAYKDLYVYVNYFIIYNWLHNHEIIKVQN